MSSWLRGSPGFQSMAIPRLRVRRERLLRSVAHANRRAKRAPSDKTRGVVRSFAKRAFPGIPDQQEGHRNGCVSLQRGLPSAPVDTTDGQQQTAKTLLPGRETEGLTQGFFSATGPRKSSDSRSYSIQSFQSKMDYVHHVLQREATTITIKNQGQLLEAPGIGGSRPLSTTSRSLYVNYQITGSRCHSTPRFRAIW